jgi:hypothetical protein
VIFNAGYHAQWIGQCREPRNGRVWKSARRGNLKVIFPSQRFHGRMERACRGIARQVDGNHGGIAQRHSEQNQQSASGLAKQRPDHQSMEKYQATHFRVALP